MVIYKVTNKLNGKIYIGQTVQVLSKRMQQHKKGTCARFKSLLTLAIQKYGFENFETTIIQRCVSMEELNLAETKAINSHDSLAPKGYNLDGGGRNKRLHADTKDKLRKARLGKPSPHTSHEAWNKGLKGVQTYAKGVEHPLFGKVKAGKPVYCTSNGAAYSSAKKAAEILGLDPSCITKVCKGKRKQDSGYTFIYMEQV